MYHIMQWFPNGGPRAIFGPRPLTRWPAQVFGRAQGLLYPALY